MLRTSLRSFYKNKVIFLTGSTGVLGTVVAEKLLRTFPDIEKLILLIRPSRKLSVQDRIKSFTNDVALSRVKPEVLSSKISWLAGELTSENLGLSEENRKSLLDSVNVVFHCAATVDFNKPIRHPLTTNLKGTFEVLKIASQMKKLQSFMYVSSCYANSNRNKVEEKLYPNKFPPKLLLKMLQSLDENTLNDLSPSLLQDWPNTYTFSKNAAELLVNEYTEKFPIGIFRPSGSKYPIISSYKEPFPSWIRKDFGSNFAIVGLSLGLVKVILSNRKGNTAFIPVDMTANALLAAAWDVSQKKNKDVNIYNYSSIENPISPSDYGKFSLKHVDDCKFGKVVGNYQKIYVITNNRFLYEFLKLLCHTAPAHIIDFYTKLTGNKPRLVNLYKIFDEKIEVNRPFSEFKITFAHDNANKLWNRMTKDEQSLLYFDVKSMDWERCLASAAFGVKKYFFEETLTESEAKLYQKYIDDDKQ